MSDGKWIIYWKEYAAETFLKGAKVKFLRKDDVEYENEFLSPGTVVKKWHSRTSFQKDMQEVTLPLIDGERRYRVTLHVDSKMKDGLLLRFVFFQRNGEVEGTAIMRGKSDIIECPIKTFSYDVELISAGETCFNFHYFSIEELEREVDEDSF